MADGADEIDMVIDRCAFLAGDHAKVFDEIAATKEASSGFAKRAKLQARQVDYPAP